MRSCSVHRRAVVVVGTASSTSRLSEPRGTPQLIDETSRLGTNNGAESFRNCERRTSWPAESTKSSWWATSAPIPTCATRRAGRASASCASRPARAGTTRTGSARSAPSGTAIVVWGKRAEVCSKYLAKGRQVFVEGRIQTRTLRRQGRQQALHHRDHRERRAVPRRWRREGGGGGGGGGAAMTVRRRRATVTSAATAAAAAVVVAAAAPTTTFRSDARASSRRAAGRLRGADRVRFAGCVR